MSFWKRLFRKKPPLTHDLVEAIINDEDYRWSWWCNLVMAYIDAGGDRKTAEEAASRFLSLLTGGRVNMKNDPMYLKDKKNREDRRAVYSSTKLNNDLLNGTVQVVLDALPPGGTAIAVRDTLVNLLQTYDAHPGPEPNLEAASKALIAMQSLFMVLHRDVPLSEQARILTHFAKAHEAIADQLSAATPSH